MDEAEGIVDLAEEENDESVLDELDGELTEVESTVEEMRLAALLRGKYDKLNAILTLHAGAGGTEACDWTEMLYRMYICYAEKHGYTITELDRLDGDEAGIKNVSFKVEGDCAYGYLKAEKACTDLCVFLLSTQTNAVIHRSLRSKSCRKLSTTKR